MAMEAVMRVVAWVVVMTHSGGRGGGDTAARTEAETPVVVAKAVVAGLRARRGRMAGVRRAPSVPMESAENEEMELPLTLQIQTRAMEHALLREACGRRIPLRRDEAELSQGATQAAISEGYGHSKAVADT